jgi:hypothetical protein
VLAFGDLHGLLVADWVPPTAENIVEATDDSILAGYTKANDTHQLRPAVNPSSTRYSEAASAAESQTARQTTSGVP